VVRSRPECRFGKHLGPGGGSKEQQKRGNRERKPRGFRKRNLGAHRESVPHEKDGEEDACGKAQKARHARCAASRNAQERLDGAPDEDLAPEKEERAAGEMENRGGTSPDAELPRPPRGEEGAEHYP
jgi:hypothetical protein